MLQTTRREIDGILTNLAMGYHHLLITMHLFVLEPVHNDLIVWYTDYKYQAKYFRLKLELG